MWPAGPESSGMGRWSLMSDRYELLVSLEADCGPEVYDAARGLRKSRHRDLESLSIHVVQRERACPAPGRLTPWMKMATSGATHNKLENVSRARMSHFLIYLAAPPWRKEDGPESKSKIPSPVSIRD